MTHTPPAASPTAATPQPTASARLAASRLTTGRVSHCATFARITAVATGISTTENRHGNSNAIVSFLVITWTTVRVVDPTAGTSRARNNRVRRTSHRATS